MTKISKTADYSFRSARAVAGPILNIISNNRRHRDPVAFAAALEVLG
jgi:hypothetical protein